MSLLACTYLETSAVDAFIRNPAPFGEGPFVVSEYVLAEKGGRPFDDYKRCVLDLQRLGVLFLRVPPVGQIIENATENGLPSFCEAVALDVEACLTDRPAAVEGLDRIRRGLAPQFADRYSQLRPHFADWIAGVEDGQRRDLLDPRSPKNQRLIVEAATLDILGRTEPPGENASPAEILRWSLRAWETAMVFVRIERSRDSEKDLQNDPVDGVHYALATTFCAKFATSDRDLCRIRDLISSPRRPLLWVFTNDGAIRIELKA